MKAKVFQLLFVTYLMGYTNGLIPEGEYQIGPLFGSGGRFFGGNKHFEALFDQGSIKPLLAKKVLIGAGALAAAGGAALLAKKIHESKNHGFGGHGWYPYASSHHQQQGYGGYDYQPHSSYHLETPSQSYQQGNVNFPSSNYYTEGGFSNSNYLDNSNSYYSGWSR